MEQCTDILKQNISERNSDFKVVMFFDEINTNKNISGILKEILVDRHLNGK